MNVSDALRAGATVLVRRPATVLPFYLLGLGVNAAARVPLLVAGALAVAHLARLGRLDPLARAVRELDPAAIDPDGPGGAPPTPPPELRAAVEGLATPTAVGLLAVGTALAVVVWLVLRSVAAAGTLHAVHAFVRDRDPATTGVAGIGADWRTFLGLQLLRGAILGTVLATIALLPGVAGLLAALLALLVVPAVLLALAFAGQAVVVDRTGVTGAVRRSLAVPVRRPGGFLAYLVVVVSCWSLAFAGLGVLAAVGAPRAGALVLALVVPPVVDAFKTALYAEGRLPVHRGTPPVLGGLRSGLWALGRFVREHPLAVLAAAVVLLASGGAGYAGALELGTRLPLPSDPAGGLESLGAGGFVNIAANNWLVAAGTAFGGLAFGVPTIAALAFNGALVGAIAGVVDPRAFLALVGPHAVLELPAIAIAGGLGVHLAGVGWRGLRGRLSPREAGAELTFAFRVLVGLAVVFAAAAAVEAFLTPRIAARVLAVRL